MRKTILLLVPFILTLFVVNRSYAQVVLTVGGEVDELLELTMDELKELPVNQYMGKIGDKKFAFPDYST